MNTIKFALKNIKSNLKFYIPFFLLLSICVFIYTTILALSIGAHKLYQRTGSENLLAVFEDNRACPLASLVPETYRTRLEDIPHIEDIMSEVRHRIVYAPGKTLTLTGVEPDKFRNFKDINISDREYENFKKDRHSVIIGKKVQNIFNWKIGESVDVQGLKFNVSGVFEVPLSIYNGMIIFHVEYLQELVNKKGNYTAFTIKIDTPENKSKVSNNVEQLFENHPSGIACKPETEFWGRTERQMGNFGKNMKTASLASALLLFSFIANGVIFILKNRRNEKILSGFERKKLFTLFFTEPMISILVAGIVGSFLAYITWLNIPIQIGGSEAILPPLVVNLQIIIRVIFTTLIFGLITISLSAYKFAK